MPKGNPRPELRKAVGERKEGRSAELEGEPLRLEGYDLPMELDRAGSMQWLTFAQDPMPWWTVADLSTIAQYCAALDHLVSASPSNWANMHREVRMLGDQLGLTPMARARMAIGKTPEQRDTDTGEGKPAEVIDAADLFGTDG